MNAQLWVDECKSHHYMFSSCIELMSKPLKGGSVRPETPWGSDGSTKQGSDERMSSLGPLICVLQLGGASSTQRDGSCWRRPGAHVPQVLMIMALQSLVTLSDMAKAWKVPLNTDRVDSQARRQSRAICSDS